LTDKDITLKLSSSLSVLLLDLLYRAQRQAFDGHDVIDKQQHQQLCIALSKLAHQSPSIQWYVTLSSSQAGILLFFVICSNA